MCYSQPLSIALAIFGWAVVAWLALRTRSPPAIVAPLAFYAFMETLQAVQYSVLDQCGAPINYALTLVAHVLVIAQPCVWNAYRLARARTAAGIASRAGDAAAAEKHRRAAAVFGAFVGLSLVWATFFTIRLLPSNPVRAYLPATASFEGMRGDEIMVGRVVCTRSGPTHLFWTLPYATKNGLEANFWAYLALWFYPAVYEPRGWLKLAYWLAQVVLINYTAGNIHELPTTWCALSVPILMVILLFDRADVALIPSRRQASSLRVRSSPWGNTLRWGTGYFGMREEP